MLGAAREDRESRSDEGATAPRSCVGRTPARPTTRRGGGAWVTEVEARQLTVNCTGTEHWKPVAVLKVTEPV
jgi:hypothetical protein